jgi:hypothetical protein
MSFCTSCGFHLSEDILQGNFCPECGSLLEKEEGQIINQSSAKSPPPLPDVQHNKEKSSFSKPKLPPVPGRSDSLSKETEIDEKRYDVFENGYRSYGIIFTDTRRIAKKCRSTSNDIYNIIKKYTQRLKKHGHQYIIYDIDSTRYRQASWHTYVDELSNFYNKQTLTPEYLFIIGGDDVIPMAVFDCIETFEVPDFDYESDIPYSYLKSYELEDMIWDGSLYYEHVKLHVGRLPFGDDFEKSQLSNYFDKVIGALETEFQINNCFSLSAEGWQDASETILNDLEISNKFIDFSPNVSLRDIDDIFDETSDILYFNLHGSESPEQPQFFGDWEAAISPDQISRLVKNNLILTEACYGAKFIGYNTSNSMLLNSIHNNTLAYIGSSRIAFGSNSSFLFSADIIAQSVLRALSKNLTMGQAISKARIAAVESSEDDIAFIDMALATAIEFNLFGDPTIRSYNKKSTYNESPLIKITKALPDKPEKSEIYNKASSQNILDAVRFAVDMEFDKISKIIQKQLYEKYELTTDQLQKISYQKSSMKEEYLYVYKQKNKNFAQDKLYYVNATKSGVIKKVITSK